MQKDKKNFGDPVEFIQSMRTFAHAHHDVVSRTSFSSEEDHRVITRVFYITQSSEKFHIAVDTKAINEVFLNR